MPVHDRRAWVPEHVNAYVTAIASEVAAKSANDLEERILGLVDESRVIHEDACINLNPATNVLNPKAEAILARGLGSRPSLGYPGDKYEMGLEAIEKIEIIAAELAAEIFEARFAEIRVGSGALANLYAFMATTKPGDAIIAPPAAIGGHVTHHDAGAAGLYGLKVHAAPVNIRGHTVDVEALRALARDVKPKLITIGGSLNLFEHPVGAIREIADEAGAKVLFDAAHQCGLIAGRVWQNPLKNGAHIITMSTYKSLGGPAGGLVLTNDADLAQRIDGIAYPGLTANFDVAKSASLAMTLLDWREYGRGYAEMMVATAKALASALDREGAPVFARDRDFTSSHQFAVEAARYGGGQAAAKRLRRANILTSGIGLPIEPVAGDLNGLRLGTPEIVRWGMEPRHMPALAKLIARGLELGDAAPVAADVSAFRGQFKRLHFIRQGG